MDWEHISVIDEDKKLEKQISQRKYPFCLSGTRISQISYTIPEIWLNNIRDGAQSLQTKGGTSVAHYQ